MYKLFSFVYDYLKEQDRTILILVALFTALLVFLNYRFGLEKKLCYNDLPYANFWGHYLIYTIAFTFPYLLYWLIGGRNHFTSRPTLVLIFGAPAIFAFIVSVSTNLSFFSDPLWNDYLNRILFFPIRVAILLPMLFIIWKMFYQGETFFGINVASIEWAPYLIMLLLMVPLIGLAATQSDFLDMYPRVERVVVLSDTVQSTFWYKMLYEFSYGFSFVSVEFFFRGFLILAFMRYVGRDAILPMACFYCTIHFGKPLGECISSFFGGIILGAFVYNTGSIYGGLMVHLGIAWLMELMPMMVRKYL